MTVAGTSHRLIHRLGRAALGVPFISLGLDSALEPGGRVDAAADLGLPYPEEMVRFNGAAMVLGGAALVTGVKPRAAALGLIAALVPTTAAGHAYWKLEDPDARAAQRIQVLKNLAMVGGLLMVAAHRPERRKKRRHGGDED